MATIFNGKVADTSPVISATVNYEHTRDGANMKYMVEYILAQMVIILIGSRLTAI